jgi:hypothetical protein
MMAMSVLAILITAKRTFRHQSTLDYTYVLGCRREATFDEFDDMLTKFWKLKSRRVGGSSNSIGNYPWPTKSPVEHVRSQFKDALGEEWRNFRIDRFMY